MKYVDTHFNNPKVCAVSGCDNPAEVYYRWDNSRFLVICRECDRRASFSSNKKGALSSREKYLVFQIMKS